MVSAYLGMWDGDRSHLLFCPSMSIAYHSVAFGSVRTGCKSCFWKIVCVLLFSIVQFAELRWLTRLEVFIQGICNTGKVLCNSTKHVTNSWKSLDFEISTWLLRNPVKCVLKSKIAKFAWLGSMSKIVGLIMVGKDFLRLNNTPSPGIRCKTIFK